MEAPAWLTHNPWQAGATGPFSHHDPLDDEPTDYELTVVELGSLTVPSGRLLATSLCMDITREEDGCGGWLEVPAGEARLLATMASEGGRKPEMAYLSMIFAEGEETRRTMATRQGTYEPDARGILHVDKYILALADLDAFTAAFPDMDALDDFLDDTVFSGGTKLDDASFPFGDGSAVLRSLRVPNGIAGAVLGLDAAGTTLALHLQCFVIGSTGEDGQFDEA